VNGKDVIELDGTNDEMILSLGSALPTFAVVMFVKPTRHQVYDPLFSHTGATAGYQTLYDSTDNALRVWSNAHTSYADTGVGSYVQNTWQMVGWQYSDPNIEVFINGALAGSGSRTGGSLDAAARIGAGNGFYNFKGQIAEVVVCNAILTTEDWTNLAAYATSEYGI
jgi:hypothetical protein